MGLRLKKPTSIHYSLGSPNICIVSYNIIPLGSPYIYIERERERESIVKYTANPIQKFQAPFSREDRGLRFRMGESVLFGGFNLSYLNQGLGFGTTITIL